MSILLSLFLKLSAFSLIAFGGVNALLPVLLNLAVNQEHWIDLQTFSDYFAIAQAAPGPNFMTVTLLGWHIYGVIGALVATLFLGGYQSPIGEEWIVGLPVFIETVVHVTIFVAKVMASFLFMMWIRWTLPRFRVDQVMRLCWLTLVPLCLVSLFGIALTLLAAGGAENGVAYGRLPGRLQPTLGPVGHLVSWAVPLVLGFVIIRIARKKHGQVHPALRQLTGGGA